jgi:DNA invertase Pin-like site-specific DNA recombinase
LQNLSGISFASASNRGLAAAKARGVVLGRKVGQRPSDKKAKRVLSMHCEGLSYRLIGRNLGLSKNTVMEIVRREGVIAD